MSSSCLRSVHAAAVAVVVLITHVCGSGGHVGATEQLIPPGFDCPASNCFCRDAFGNYDSVIKKDIPFATVYNQLLQENQTLNLDLYTSPAVNNSIRGISSVPMKRPAAIVIHGGRCTHRVILYTVCLYHYMYASLMLPANIARRRVAQ